MRSDVRKGFAPRLKMRLTFRKFRGVSRSNVDAFRKGGALPHIKRQSRGRHSLRPTAHRTLLAAFFFLLTAHCTLPTASAVGVWQRQRTSSLAWLHSVFFLDQNRGWVVGSRGTLLATTDSGTHWRSLVHPTEDTIRELYFADELNGIIVCERNIYDLKSNAEARAYLMKTADGGEHWKRVSMRGVDLDARIMRAIFTGAGRGWAFGEAGVVYTTRDMGATWTRLQAPTRYLLLGGTFVDENSGWLVGAGATILQTSDGGESWQHARLPATTNVRFNSTSFVEKRLGWAVGSGGVIYRTINGGRSWQPQNSGVETDLFDVKFLDAAEGWAVGAEGVLLHTTDGGTHWISERSETNNTLERIFFSDSTHGWAVGFGGTVIAFGNTARLDPPRLRR
jgi:photosystem II stability/assembly factor-like uncharacterized protein